MTEAAGVDFASEPPGTYTSDHGTTWEAYDVAMAGARQHGEASHTRLTAWWYAVGRLDERKHPTAATTADAFALGRAIDRIRYDNKERFHLLSVQDAFARFDTLEVTR